MPLGTEVRSDCYPQNDMLSFVLVLSGNILGLTLEGRELPDTFPTARRRTSSWATKCAGKTLVGNVRIVRTTNMPVAIEYWSAAVEQ